MLDTNDLFGLLGSEFCLYFEILAGVKLFIFVLIILGILYTGIMQKHSMEFYFVSILLSFGYLLSYLENRMLFTMCGRTL